MPSTTSDNNETPELKAGHPPAFKVGNMRVVQRTYSTSSNHSDKHAEDDEAAGGDSNVPSACSFAPKTVVKQPTGGVPENQITQSVPEAVKHFHDKQHSVATHEFRGHSNKPNVIQQPKK